MSTKARSTDEAMGLPLQSVRGEQVGQIFAESELDYAVAGIQVDAAGVRSRLTASPSSLSDHVEQYESGRFEDIAPRHTRPLAEAEGCGDHPDTVLAQASHDVDGEGGTDVQDDHDPTVPWDGMYRQVRRRDVP